MTNTVYLDIDLTQDAKDTITRLEEIKAFFETELSNVRADLAERDRRVKILMAAMLQLADKDNYYVSKIEPDRSVVWEGPMIDDGCPWDFAQEVINQLLRNETEK